MNRFSLATALSALIFVIPSCSETEASSAAGAYVVDMKPTLDGVIAKEAKGTEIPADQRVMMEKMFSAMFEKMTYNLNGDLTFDGAAEMTIMGTTTKMTTKGTWTIDNGKITLNTTHEDGKEKKSTHSATYKDGRLTVQIDQAGKSLTVHMIKKS